MLFTVLFYGMIEKNVTRKKQNQKCYEKKKGRSSKSIPRNSKSKRFDDATTVTEQYTTEGTCTDMKQGKLTLQDVDKQNSINPEYLVA